ncbi:hypothetical protein RM572_08855 [Streptomyces sp. DSM 42041]|uniref:Integral membrane protein n=1 Tax=Streptomyces hazeniae TaxID=3075538 RepID=A0ABU2NQ25_9ACTN|nr:hypothetical protein [Streptomyces sp. DSM 42041]MDT0378880.1 hypothetical protein [Streptomyces sp. DSM 42041]
MTAGADLRLLRAAVFTAVCVLLSAAGHSAAAGTPVPLWTLGAGCAVVLAAAVPLAGRERALPGIAAALAAGQVVLHVLFSAGHAPASAPPARPDDHGVTALARSLLCGDGGRALSEGEARRIVADAGLPAETAAPGAGGAHPHAGGADAVPTALDAALAQLSLPMLLGHLLAAVALGWLLRRGEAALWRLVRLSATTARAAEELLTVRALRAAVRLLGALRRGLTASGGHGPDAVRRADRDRTPDGPTAPLTGAVTRRGPPPAKDDLHLAA